MSDGPTIIVQDDKFRIVRITEGDRVTYVTERPDGCDALGVERWAELKMDNKHWAAFRDYMIRTALKEKS
jgi:hypothetical protein